MVRDTRKRIIVRVLLLGLAAVLLVLSGCGTQDREESAEAAPDIQISAEDPAPASVYTLSVVETTENGEKTILTTSYGSICYPFAFSDLISVETDNTDHSASLAFFANVDGEKLPVFTIVFNGQEGIFLGHMTIPDADEPVPVHCVLCEPGEAFSEGDVISFYAAQECFNDVAVSLAENDGFIPADD